MSPNYVFRGGDRYFTFQCENCGTVLEGPVTSCPKCHRNTIVVYPKNAGELSFEERIKGGEFVKYLPIGSYACEGCEFMAEERDAVISHQLSECEGIGYLEGN
jgi:rubrerythrin